MFINRIYYISIEFNIFLNVYNISALIEFISQQFILKLRKNKTIYSIYDSLSVINLPFDPI